MIGEKRSRLEILQEIMHLAGQGHKKTRIMYGANLSYEMLNKYMDFLRTKGFITVDEETGKYAITDTGLEFIRDLDRVTRHFRVDEKVLALR